MIAPVIHLPPPAELREIHGMASFDSEARLRAEEFAKALGVPVEIVLLVRTEEKRRRLERAINLIRLTAEVE